MIETGTQTPQEIATRHDSNGVSCITCIDNCKDLFDDMLDMVHMYDTNGQIIFMNKICYERLGHAPKDLHGCSLERIIKPAQKEDIQSTFAHALKTEQKVPVKFSLCTKNGREVLVSGHFLTMSTFCHRMVKGVFHEITIENKILQTQELYFDIVDYHAQTPSLTSFYRRIFKKLHQILRVPDMMVLSKGKKATRFSHRFVHYSTRKNISDKERDACNSMCKILSQDILDRQNAILVYEHGIKSMLDRHHITLDHIPTIWAGTQIPLEGDQMKVICFYSYDSPANYNYSELELLNFVGKQVSVAIERKHREWQVSTQNARINSMFDSSTHQIWFVNRKGMLTAFNTNFSKALQNDFGVTPMVGRYAVGKYAFMPPTISNTNETMRIWRDQYARAFQGHALNFETYFIDKKGKKIWKQIFLRPVYLPSGAVREVSAIAQDITSKKIAEIALYKSEEKFRAIFESFQDLYFCCDRNGTVTVISPSVQDITGWTPEEIMGKDICTFIQIPSAKENSCEGGLFHILDKETTWKNVEMIIIGKQGKKSYCICNFRLLPQGRSHSAWIEGVARDISQLKETSEQLRKARDAAEDSLKIKQNFLANMSHEIRTPINGMIGMLSLLETDSLNKEQKQCVQAIKESSESLFDILNDILYLSKIEAGKSNLKLRTVQVKDIFSKLHDLFNHQVRTNNNMLVMHLPKDMPAYLRVDETRLLQILSNLISNALKFSKGKGNIHIALSILDVVRDDLTLKVSIKDHGIGIAPTDRHLLFEKFSQAETSMKKNFGGTGLGLAISKYLAVSMGGEIGMFSTYGMGSTFWFTIRAHTTEPLTTTTDHGKSEEIKGALASLKPFVLVVDDNEINLKVSSEILKRAGCTVKTASSGHEAIELAVKHTFDLIFMDIQMPEKDGIETTKDIRACLSQVPPVIAVTAYSMEEDKVRFLNQGMDDYISKPMRPHYLMDKVRYWMGNASSRPLVKETVQPPIKKTERVHWKALRSLAKHGGWTLVKEAYRDFHVELDKLMLSSQKAIQRSDYKTLAKHLHTLKGNSGTLGLHTLAKSMEILEQRIKIQQYERVLSTWKDIEREVTFFKEKYKIILDKIDGYDKENTDS